MFSTMAICQLQPGHHLVRWPTENDDSESAWEATLRQQHPGSGDRGRIKVLGPQRKMFLTGILANTLPALPFVLQ